MLTRSRDCRRFLLLALVLAGTAQPALAYIGPGAGIAAAGSLLVLVGTFALALGIILLWPIKAVLKIFTSMGKSQAKVKRVIVVGLDGLDPGLAQKYMDEGRMPNFKKLAEEGHFSTLATACPSISPVAWSSYATGVDASRHNIYDFLTRDPCSYLPVLSSSEVGVTPRDINLGVTKIPFGSKPFYRFLQKSQPFWKLLGANNVWSSIIRVPITFPPQKFKNGTLLSGMCVPDIQGTQGSFAFYSTKKRADGIQFGGQQYTVNRRGNVIESKLTGPPGSDGNRMKVEFKVELDDAKREATFTIEGETHTVGYREYTPWMRVPFKGVTGIVRLYMHIWEGDNIGIYATPINIDPDSPAMPISHPFVYSIYLAKLFGPFSTLGLAEDTWALNERVVDEEAFLKQAWLIFDERKTMLWDVLAKTKKGFATVVFDTTDRISHMFYRYLDPEHPANVGKDTETHKDVIPELYGKMDDFLAEIQEKIGDDPDTVLMVISDHGFTTFRRGVNLNTWLKEEGYLVLKEGKETSGDYLREVDWEKTKAFTLGLTGIFINRKGRESQGIVSNEELPGLCQEIKEKLEKLLDPKSDERVVREAFITKKIHSGPYADAAPDLLIGYHRGFRHSWDCATGAVSAEIFTDNTKSWSGDHCVDPRLVPGVFWCNREVPAESPELVDMAPTMLDLFGCDIPPYMQGKPLFNPGAKPGKKVASPGQDQKEAS
ncbi:MAG: putative AlkP superfamily phosphohydrolase/phosphomutase [Candidatus Paceibacteria bacterium]|jgi:predicted AlkP superfamily phosphohydrolase/phosphomutase